MNKSRNTLKRRVSKGVNLHKRHHKGGRGASATLCLKPKSLVQFKTGQTRRSNYAPWESLDLCKSCSIDESNSPGSLTRARDTFPLISMPQLLKPSICQS
ncbi:hypothetical protein AVEN_162691-1 [Araneus ventricosus]|uniref:Uncharacterized protein n=1 Tax=Araneus ventricosus TaxID=182803 RepID=A0A4Y2IF73_ARAVE|nr:hypothetical protein AVEN_162691-1 [Araneus ventricosus]